MDCVVCITQHMERISMGFLSLWEAAAFRFRNCFNKIGFSASESESGTQFKGLASKCSVHFSPTPPTSSYSPRCVSRSCGALTPIPLTACPTSYRRLAGLLFESFCRHSTAVTLVPTLLSSSFTPGFSSY